MKKYIKYVLLFLLAFIPNVVFAYSDKLILGGESLGITVNTKNVMVVGFYKIDDYYQNDYSDLKIGDYIVSVENNDINNIDELISEIDKNKNKDIINIKYLRNDKEYNTKIKLYNDNDIIKTGIYVKDKISGIGTLTYIDPTTNIFGALGHEISSKDTLKKVDIKDGKIYESIITGITKAELNKAGSKNAKLISDNIYGDINKNTKTGIYGTINDYINNKEIYILKKEDVKLGDAHIRTVIDNKKVEEFKINILNIDYNNDTKNILFEVVDKKLIDKTGGIVAGMSGSPIIQNDKLVGAVTHVILNENNKGYGIFIESMLKDGEE